MVETASGLLPQSLLKVFLKKTFLRLLICKENLIKRNLNSRCLIFLDVVKIAAVSETTENI